MELENGKMKLSPRITALIAVLLWSSGALFVLTLDRLPTFLLLAFSSSIGLVLTATFLTATKRWKLLMPHQRFILPTSSLIIITQLGYVLAFRWAPAAQVDLLYYLWPSALILLTSSFSSPHTTYLVVASGAGGIFLAFGPGLTEQGHLFGYIATITSALSWIVYSLIVRKHKLPLDLLCINLGLGAPVYWTLHFLMEEPSIAITLHEGALLFLYGGGVCTTSYLCWGHAVTFGSVSEASALSYLIPVLSMSGLASFGYIEFTPHIAMATVLVLIAAAIPMISSRISQLGLKDQCKG